MHVFSNVLLVQCILMILGLAIKTANSKLRFQLQILLNRIHIILTFKSRFSLLFKSVSITKDVNKKNNLYATNKMLSNRSSSGTNCNYHQHITINKQGH